MMLDSVERYIKGEMNPDERLFFENLRKTNSEIDQMVVEHTLFLRQVNRYATRKDFAAGLQDIHHKLENAGNITTPANEQTGKLVFLWKKYRRVAGIAASIAGVTAIGLSLLFNSVAPHPKDPQVKELVSKIDVLNETTKQLDQKIEHVKNKADNTAANNNDIAINARYNGTGFLIDGKGLMITNAHVVKRSVNIYVQNNKGEKFKAIVLKQDPARDVAIIKIVDDRFKPVASLPYGIRKTASDIAEPIFTLAFNDKMVYGEGYLSAKTGFNGDTLSFQISVPANPGNSGGPVFNRNGEIIGILSAKDVGVEGAVFAVQSKYIFLALDSLRKNQLYEKVKVSQKSTLSGLDQTVQVKKIEDYIFMVKGD
ncbi:S1C family serine protease [Terrimonas rubra]|uniref:S1C family serine protease n=1 Tax=Terrimonas rubra TaxID=1035890 RepID=A0ABW6A4R9_9BACT